MTQALADFSIRGSKIDAKSGWGLSDAFGDLAPGSADTKDNYYFNGFASDYANNVNRADDLRRELTNQLGWIALTEGIVRLPNGFNPNALHNHHLLPMQYADEFAKAGISNLDDYICRMNALDHIKIHANMGGNWNKVWKNFLKIDRSTEEIWT